MSVRTVIIKNLSTIRNHIVVGMIEELLHGDRDPEHKAAFESMRDHYLLTVRRSDDTLTNRVTFTVTDREDA